MSFSYSFCSRTDRGLGSTTRFKGIYANITNENRAHYDQAFRQQPEAHQFRTSITALYRGLYNTAALAKVLNKQPVTIHILGCSDGSQGHAYAIAFQQEYGAEAAKQINIMGIDKRPALTKLAKTGYLLCTDHELSHTASSLKALFPAASWHDFLEKSAEAPPAFQKIVQDYPVLQQITRDPVSQLSIGQGMHWYKVKQEILPPIEFKFADMTEYVKSNPSKKPVQVYVLANAWGYLLDGNPSEKKKHAFLQVIEDIKNNNVNKIVYTVIGTVEADILNQEPSLIAALEEMGLNRVPKDELIRAGVPDPENVFGSLWKLSPCRIYRR